MPRNRQDKATTPKILKGWRKLRVGTLPTANDKEHNGVRWIRLPDDLLGEVCEHETIIRKVIRRQPRRGKGR